MCGIIGFNRNNFELGQRMTGSIAHRGPDDEGVFVDDLVTLGNRRLAILDVSALGHQPMKSEDENYVLTYNGEIYNFKEIRQELQQHGWHFISESDTEVILKGYQQYGEQLFEKLRGMWALAIYDKKNKKLTISRDYFGIKPLFYYHCGTTFAFASELKALKTFLSDSGKSFQLSPQGMEEFFILGYSVHPNTIYESIKKVIPGGVLIFDLVSNAYTERKIRWEPSAQQHSGSLTDAFERVCMESVEKHLISDVPVGVFLSGGVDSTCIALMMKRLGVRLRAFTVRIQGRRDAEYAQQIAAFTGLDHTEFDFDQNAFDESYEQCWEMLDEPIADTALLPGLCVSKRARQEVKVVLTGEGGDELFLGYPRFSMLTSLHHIGGSSSFIAAMNALRFPKLRTYLQYIRPLARRFRLGVERFGLRDLWGTYLESAAVDFDTQDRSAVYAKGLRDFTGDDDPARFDRQWYLPNDLLYKTDFVTMANSIEARVPFLDKNVFDFARSLPMSWKLSQGTTKRIMRDYLAKHLPPALLAHPKEGFSVPLLSYSTPTYEEDSRKAIAYLADIGRAYPWGGFWENVRDQKDLADLMRRKFRHMLFMAVAFYKTTTKFL